MADFPVCPSSERTKSELPPVLPRCRQSRKILPQSRFRKPFRRNTFKFDRLCRTIPQSLRDSSLYTREPLPRPPACFGTIPSGAGQKRPHISGARLGRPPCGPRLCPGPCPVSIVNFSKELPALGYGQFIAAVVFFVLGVALDPVAGDAVLFT